jgi:hypothetical protein
MPTRVARHELRMALLRVEVDADALAEIERVEFGAFDARRVPAGVFVRGGFEAAGEDSTCVSPDRPLVIDIPRPATAAHVVVITEPVSRASPPPTRSASLRASEPYRPGDAGQKMSRAIPTWSLTLDGQAVDVEPPPGVRGHPRATLGPIPLSIPPALPPDGRPPARLKLEIRGVGLPDDARGPGSCPFGRVAAVVLLPRERSSVFELEPASVELATLAPARTLGHPIEPTAWVAGRSLSRYRPGTQPPPELVGLAMRMPTGTSLRFAPVDLPLDERGRPRGLDVLVTLAGTETQGPAQLHVYADERELGTIEVPVAREGKWIAEPIAWQPSRGRAQLRVELHSPGGGAVALRDVALFARHDGLEPGD